MIRSFNLGLTEEQAPAAIRQKQHLRNISEFKETLRKYKVYKHSSSNRSCLVSFVDPCHWFTLKGWTFPIKYASSSVLAAVNAAGKRSTNARQSSTSSRYQPYCTPCSLWSRISCKLGPIASIRPPPKQMSPSYKIASCVGH